MAEAIRRVSRHPVKNENRRTTMADAIRRVSRHPSSNSRRGSRRPTLSKPRRASRRPSKIQSSSNPRRGSRRPSSIPLSARRPSALPSRRLSSLPSGINYEEDEHDDEKAIPPPGLDDFHDEFGRTSSPMFEDIEEHEDEIHYQERRVSSIFIENEDEEYWVPKSIAAHLCFAAHFSCLKKLELSRANLDDSVAKEIDRVLKKKDIRRRVYKSERLTLDLEGNDEISEKTRSSLEKSMMSLETLKLPN